MSKKSKIMGQSGKLRAWNVVKDEVYGDPNTERRKVLDRDAEAFTVGLMLKQARERLSLTQEQLANRVNKKRAFISRVENDGSNITLKTLHEIVEKGLGGRVGISIEWDETHE